MKLFLLILVAGLLVFCGDASAQDVAANVSASGDVASIPSDAGGLIGTAIDYFRAGKILAGGAIVLMLIGASLRRVVGLFASDFAASKTGGKLIGGVSAFATALGTGYIVAGFSVDMLLAAIVAAGAAAGLWSAAPDIAKAKIRPGG